MFQAIVNHLMEKFVQNVGDPSKLSLKTARQFNADTSKTHHPHFNPYLNVYLVFLLDALQDLRLEPLPSLISLSERLSELCSR